MRFRGRRSPLGKVDWKTYNGMHKDAYRRPRMNRDPVCGMELKPGQEEAEAQHAGQTYHFCSRECRDLFVNNPQEYLKAAAEGRQ